MPKKYSNSQIIKRVTAIRRRNNRCWMSLLKIALDSNPKAKKIVREIVKNDAKVTKWMARV